MDKTRSIFISYRRADSAESTGRIYDWLIAHFGKERVFKDVDSIPPGVDFAEYIAHSIGQSAVQLVIIGPHWLDASDDMNRRRIDDPSDFVRIEIETALKQGVAVIPVLVMGALMPPVRDLPDSLKRLVKRNGLQIRPDPDFHRDMDRVIASVEHWMALAQPTLTPSPSIPPTPASVEEAIPPVKEVSAPPASQPSLPTTIRSALTSQLTAPASISTAPDVPPYTPRRRFQTVAAITTITLVVALIAIVFNWFSPGNLLKGSRSNLSALDPYSAAKGCMKIGFLLPESDTSTRWEANDHPDMVAAIKQYIPNASLDVTNANGSDTTQLSQAEADLTKGDCILIVAPHDSTAAAIIVEKALTKHVPIIAFDRLIQDKNTAFYVSVDNKKVGELQGQYIADHYEKYVTAAGNNNLVVINGSQTDNTALLFKQGAHQALDPLISAGKLKNVYEKFTPNWDNPTAQTEMRAALTQTDNKVAVAYVANDAMAETVIAALQQAHLAGKVLVTGQDSTIAGIKNILQGYQSMTIYKSISKEAKATAQLVAALSNGASVSAFTNGATTATLDGGSIPSVLVTPVVVDKNNIASTVLAEGFVTKKQICQGIPAGTDGIC